MLKEYGKDCLILFDLVQYGSSDLYTAGGVSIPSEDVRLIKASDMVSAPIAATNTVYQLTTTGIYMLSLTAVEMSTTLLVIKIVDQTSPKAYHDRVLFLETGKIMENIIAYDTVLVTTTTPWTLEYRRPGTSDAFATKDLKDTVGNGISTTTQIIGQQVMSGT